MSTTIESPLSRRDLSEIEPRESNATSSSSLPSSSIPDAVTITTVKGGLVQRIEFRYPVGPLTLSEPVLIDEGRSPAVSVAFSEGMRRVVRLQFFPPVPFGQVQLVAGRLRNLAKSESITGKRLSLHLTAGIIEDPLLCTPPDNLTADGTFVAHKDEDGDS